MPSSGNAIAFDPTMTHDEHAAGWFRPYTSFEKIGLKNGPKVENNMYGSYFGDKSEMKDLGHGFDAKWAIGKGGNSSSKTSSNYSAGHSIATPNVPEQKKDNI